MNFSFLEKILIGTFFICIGITESTPLIYWQEKLSIGDACIAILILGSLFKREIFNNTHDKFILGGLALISVISMCLNSLINPNYPILYGYGHSLRYIFYFLLFSYLTKSVNNSQRLQFVLRFFGIGLAINLMLAWFWWLREPRYIGSIPMLHIYQSSLMSNFYMNKNHLGFFLAIGYGFFLPLTIRKKSWNLKYISTVSICLILLISSILSFSKGTWLMCISITLVFIALQLRKKRFKIIQFLPIILIFSTAIILLTAKYEGGDLVESALLKLDSYEDSINGRIGYFSEGIYIMFSHLALGVGPKGYFFKSDFGTRDPHNCFVWIGSELGIIALLLFATAILYRFPKNLLLVEKRSIHSHFLTEDIALLQSFTIWIALIASTLVSGQALTSKIFISFWALSVVLTNKFSRTRTG